MSQNSLNDNITEAVWQESDPTQRCPFIVNKYHGRCICTSPTNQRPAPDVEVQVSHIELQLWCLDGEKRYKKCIFHPDFLANADVE